MREDENHTRHFMPLVRRGIILAAVVAAVPVVMWTITGLVRNYLGQPQASSIQTMSASPVAAAPDQMAAATDNPPAAAPEAQVPVAPPVNAASNTPAGSGAGPAITITSSVAPAANAPAAPPAPKPSSKLAMSNPAASPPANLAPSAAPLPLARPSNDIWPAAPMVSASTEPAVTASADDLPQAEPIAGPVPLPKKRPRSFITAQSGVPLPRPRPMALAAAAPSGDDTPSAPLDWLYTLFQRPSSPAPPPAPEPQPDRLNVH